MKQSQHARSVDVDSEGPLTPLTVTFPDAGALLSVSIRQVYRLVDIGVLEARNFGRARRITTRSLRRAAHGDAEQQ